MSTTMSLADLYASAPQPRYRGVKTTSLYLTMRDGVLVAVDVLLPAASTAGTPRWRVRWSTRTAPLKTAAC
jgi:predicted acyl esterase